MVILLAFAFVIALTSNPPGYSIPPAPFPVAGGILFKNGYAKLKDFGVIEGSAIDSAIGGYGYSSSDSSLIAGGNFISIGEQNSAMQLKISIDSNVMCVRGRNFDGEWGAWKTVSLK